MKYLPTNVRGTRDDARGYGYIVMLPNWRGARGLCDVPADIERELLRRI